MSEIIGVIGGSGLYSKEMSNTRELEVETPFGPPSDKITVGESGDVAFAFLPRHGKGHVHSPSTVNYRANVFAMKKIGAKAIISVSAVGSMKEEIPPGMIVIPDQYIDFTKGRASSFFTNGIVAHVSMADPVCPSLRELVCETAQELGFQVKNGGVYLNMEGPQFSTRAESNMYRSFGVDVIGMTNFTEAKLAREAELCYVTMAMSTDYDCWHETEEAVTGDAIIKTLMENVDKAKKILQKLPQNIDRMKPCNCGDALKDAIFTDRAMIPYDTKRTLEPIIGKYIK